MGLITATFCVALGSFFLVCAGEHHVTCSTEPIQAEEGDDVTLRFCLDPPVDLSGHTLDVSRPDLRHEVHVYRDRKDLSEAQMTWYRNRTTLLHEDLQRGRVTLEISSVQLRDSGQYRLFVPDLNTVCDVDLRVAEKGRHHMTTTEAPRTKARQHVAAIVGGVVGGGALLLLLLLGLIAGVLVIRGKIKLSSLSGEVCSWFAALCKAESQHHYTPGRQESEPQTDGGGEQELQSEV